MRPKPQASYFIKCAVANSFPGNLAPVAVDILNMVIWGWLLVQQPHVPSTEAFGLQEVVMVLDLLPCDFEFFVDFLVFFV